MPPLGQSLDEQRTALSVLLWGLEGTGKTTSALRMTAAEKAGKVVLINAEAGAKAPALRAHGIDPSRVIVWPTQEQGPGHITYETLEDEVIKPMKAELAENPKAYVGVVIDSFTEVARRLLEDVVEKAYEAAIRQGKNRSRWFVDLADHGVAASQMRSALREFRDLGLHLVITSLERRDIDQQTAAVKYGPALGPAVATDTTGLVDIVGYCQVERFGEGDTAEDFRTATFTPTQTRRAKDRYGVLPVTMVDPYFDRILGYIEGTLNRDNDPARARLLAVIAGSTPPEAPAGPEVAEEAVSDPEEPVAAMTGVATPPANRSDLAARVTRTAKKENV